MLIHQNILSFGNKTAIIDQYDSYTYNTLVEKSEDVSQYLLSSGMKKGDRIAFLFEPSFDFVVTLFGIWKAGGIAVPLCTVHPVVELQYVINNSQAKYVIFGAGFQEKKEKLYCDIILFLEINPRKNIESIKIDELDDSLILYTSGTTNKPKGVLHTHKSLNATINGLVAAWRWTLNDHILHVLPLHHTHGLINKLLCAMAIGATCEFLPKFDAKQVWNSFCKGEITLFMAVPTVYSKLISYWDEQIKERQKTLSKGCKKLRLMVSGSAALPIPVLDKWEAISGHRLLERYGMTEIGMAISNPYSGERKAGFIGKPLPNGEVRLVDESGAVISTENEQGEIQVKGVAVFKEYWNKPKETTESFTVDGWFKTGDSAILIDDYYKILGRNSVDIIKSGGYKISALEIESKLLNYCNISECAVVGLPDDTWGEIVAVAVVANSPFKLSNLQHWAADKLAPYKIPKRIQIISKLPRNVLGKVTKKEVKKLF